MPNKIDSHADTIPRIRRNFQRLARGANGVTATAPLVYNSGTGAFSLSLSSTGGLQVTASQLAIKLNGASLALAAGGLSISAANFGDITTTVTGTVWTINNSAVTLAKMANLATNSIIGRTTAGTGVPEVLSIDGGLTNSGTSLMTKFRSLFTHFVDAGSVGTGETDLYSDTIAASQLGTNGDSLTAEYGLTLVNSASTKQVRVYFGGTVIFDTGALTITATSSISIRARVIRVNATTIRYMVMATDIGTTPLATDAVGEVSGLTLSNTNILKITGTATGGAAANNDVTAKLGTVNFEGA